jgi:hypothetical protein
MYLGGDNDLIPIGELLQSASEDFFTLANRINIGGIEEINPQLQGFLYDWAALFFIKHPFMNPTLGVPEPHTSEADARDIHTCVA